MDRRGSSRCPEHRLRLSAKLRQGKFISIDGTVFHKPRFADEAPHESIERHFSGIRDVWLRDTFTVRLNHKEIIGQCNALAFGDGHDLMLAVTIESGPLDSRSTSRGPVKIDFFTCMANDQVATFECRWEAHDQGANLTPRARGVNMLLKETGWSRVHLESWHCQHVSNWKLKVYPH